MKPNMKPARLSIVTRTDRNVAIAKVCDAISASGGWVEDQVFFSNKAATIRFEMPLRAIGTFQSRLLEEGLKAHAEAELPVGDSGDTKGAISLTFVHQEPDMKRDVPPFG